MPSISLQFGDLVPASFIERPNRFIVRCRLIDSNQIVEAHLADPGRLKELLLPDSLLYLRFADKRHRKTKWSVILVVERDSSILVSLQSTLVNQLAALALEARVVTELRQFGLVRSEYTFGNSRWDFLLQDKSERQLLLEVKSCTLVENGRAMFPDAITDRGKRQVLELARLQAEGIFQTAILFVVQRSDARSFAPADHIDPAFSEALRTASRAGVLVLVWDTCVSLADVKWGKPLSVEWGAD